MAKAVKLYRAFRGVRPKRGNDRGAALVGDFSTRAELESACRSSAEQDLATSGSADDYWLEPVTFNGDLETPVYRNAGRIERVKVPE